MNNHGRQVLEKDGGNVKALYRRAQGHLALADYVETEVNAHTLGLST